MLGAFLVLMLGLLLASIALLVEFCRSKLTAVLPGGQMYRTDRRHLHLEQGDL
jgi:hypothetical protein